MACIGFGEFRGVLLHDLIGRLTGPDADDDAVWIDEERPRRTAWPAAAVGAEDGSVKVHGDRVFRAELVDEAERH